jgi:hypothetical protein
MGKGPNAYEVNARFGDGPDVLQGYVPGGFGHGTGTAQRPESGHGSRQGIQRHVVQQNAVHPKGKEFFQLLETRHFYLHGELQVVFTSDPVHCPDHASRCCQVIVLDQNHVVKAHSMVLSSARSDGGLLQLSQTRRRLSRVQNPSPGPLYRMDKPACEGSDPRHATQEVEGHPLPGENAPQRPRQGQNPVARLGSAPFVSLQSDFHCSIDLGEHRLRDLQTGHDKRLLGQHRPSPCGSGVYRPERSPVAPAHVLGQGPAD